MATQPLSESDQPRLVRTWYGVDGEVVGERSMAHRPWMRKASNTGHARWLTGICALVLISLLAACGPRLVPASVRMMDEAEARWQASPVPSYRIVVDVERPDDRRRNELTVRQGQVVSAVVKYWDSRRRRWKEPYELNPEQAFPFTVPGLFDMVRGELRNSGRADIRVAMGGEPAFPQRIVLGPVWQDLRPFPGTEATVIVREFEPLAAEE